MASEDADRAWFEKNRGKLDKQTRKSKDDDDGDLPEPQGDEGEPGSDDDNEDDADASELKKLHRQAAKRLGLSDKTLKTLTPEALAELYEHKRSTDREHSKGREKPADTEAPEQVASEGDLDVDKLTEAFVKITDDSFHGPIKQMVAPLVAELKAQRASSAKMERAYGTLVEALEEQATSGHRASLIESFPQLKSDKVWASIKLDANALAQTERYQGKGLGVLGKLLRSAAAARFADTLTKAANDNTKRIADAQRNGSVLHAGRNAPITLSDEERDRRAAMDIFDGVDSDTVRKRVQRQTRN